ncbi:hypothetical protein [Effusibacillus consociatus]|uniref:Secreted protein n=1 Tax=Effusibacillus consociatus TaxID=1117041 RepID=A0ABV9PYJ7_9BACL
MLQLVMFVKLGMLGPRAAVVRLMESTVPVVEEWGSVVVVTKLPSDTTPRPGVGVLVVKDQVATMFAVIVH